MRKKSWLMAAMFLVILAWLQACKPSQEPLPIPEDELVELLADLHLAENAAQELPAESKDQLKARYYERIFKDHNTTQQAFEASIKILNQTPARLTEIYAQVHEVLITRETESKAQVKPK